jgi:hypothetical protein
MERDLEPCHRRDRLAKGLADALEGWEELIRFCADSRWMFHEGFSLPKSTEHVP